VDDPATSRGRALVLTRIGRNVSGCYGALVQGLRVFHEHFSFFRSVLYRELRDRHQSSLSTKLKMWRKGFLSSSFALYGLDQNDSQPYLPDLPNLLRSRRINGPYEFLLHNKLAFERVLRPFGPFPARAVGVIVRGEVISLADGDRAGRRCEARSLIRERDRLVLKPIVGGAGTGLTLVERRGDEVLVNDEPVSMSDFSRMTGELDDYLVCEFVRQHSVFAEIFPRTTNTVKVLTVWDEERLEPFVAAAVVRIGSDSSYPADAWAQGGFCAAIELETGRMGKAVSKKLRWYDSHPESGGRIEGVVVPQWGLIANEIVRIARANPFWRYVAWDIVPTESGFRILEGNNHTDIKLFQVHQPLLQDPRVRRFFERHSVIRP
jgi:hypothetical protein